MKKILGLFAAACLLCAASALADCYTGETEATTTVELELGETYTITIPAALSISFGQEETNLGIQVTALRLLAPKEEQDRVLRVKAASAAGELKNAKGDALPYTLAPGTMIFRKEESQNMCVSIPREAWNKAPAGEYMGVVTFSMECVYVAR